MSKFKLAIIGAIIVSLLVSIIILPACKAQPATTTATETTVTATTTATETTVTATTTATETTVTATTTATETVADAPAMTAKTGKLKLAFSFPHMTEFFNLVFSGIQKGSNEIGADKFDLKWTSPGQTIQAEKQLEDIDNFVRQGVDGLTMCITFAPTNEQLMPAKNAGIPIFFVQIEPGLLTELDPSLWTALSGYDCAEAGKLVGDWVLANVEPGDVGIIRGDPCIYDTKRRDGFVERIKGSGFNVVAEVNGHWAREQGMAAAETLIQGQPNLKLIYALCDDMALGAQQAVEAAGLKDQIKVVGVDGTKGAIESIKSGGVSATLNSVPYMQGYNIVKVMNDYIRGGKQVGRYNWAPIHVTDKTNADEDLKYFQ